MLKKDKEWILNIFKFRKSFPLITINSIGRHKITSPEYYWDGMKRPQDGTYCLFQYTISGNGEIKIDNNRSPKKTKINLASIIELNILISLFLLFLFEETSLIPDKLNP